MASNLFVNWQRRQMGHPKIWFEGTWQPSPTCHARVTRWAVTLLLLFTTVSLQALPTVLATRRMVSEEDHLDADHVEHETNLIGAGGSFAAALHHDAMRAFSDWVPQQTGDGVHIEIDYVTYVHCICTS
eukprot:scaffold221412_cov28-Prasinocladus_malaysianus.AAC.1